MLKNAYKMVMDDNTNGFNTLPKTVRFQLMISLSYMWSAVFSLGIGTYFMFGSLVVFHTLVLLALFFTADLFNKSRNNQLDHRMAFRDKHDGGALYDDIWGGM